MALTETDISKIQETIRSVSSYDFTDYSYNSFNRRIEKILGDYKITLDELLRNIQKDYNYLERVVRDITVNTTEFFRDTETWHNIRRLLVNRYSESPSINIWHAGCSAGQEVYSMMIMLSELGMLEKASIYATDINEAMLSTATSGRYKYHEVNEYLGNFDKVFNPTVHESASQFVNIKKYMDINKFKDYVQMSPFLMEKPLFLKHDLVSAKSIANLKFDLILCRNVLIYFNHTLQNRVIKFFYENINTNGCLIIGRHEGIIGPSSHNFVKDNAIYYKREPN
ncbi:MAG: hypothetical protein MJZ61_00285 [Bacteroidales bacterium]|nr:hypothetical protein [Bacteroidales bacterium]